MNHLDNQERVVEACQNIWIPCYSLLQLFLFFYSHSIFPLLLDCLQSIKGLWKMFRDL